MKNVFLVITFHGLNIENFYISRYTLLTRMSVGGYCMLDFTAPKSEEIVIGILVGLIVLAYVGFVYFVKTTRMYNK